MSKSTFVSMTAAAGAALALAGCGSSERVVVSAPSSVAVATTSGAQLAPREGTTTPITVTSVVAGTSCPNLQFMVSTYTFRVNAATQYTGGTCANLQAGARINFTGNRETETSQVFTVSTLTFTGTTTTPPTTTPSPSPSGTRVETEVTITGIGAGMCPELQFFVGSYTFTVSYATQYSGGSCADLAPGVRVALVGTRRDGETFIRASTLVFKRDGTSPQPPTTPPTTARPVDGEGVITTLKTGTACPALAFYIGTYLITLDQNTTFTHGACSDLAPGARVHVTGSMTGDTGVAATQISVVTAATTARPAVEGEGRVTSLVFGTSCPALTFMIQEYRVMLDGSTTFVGGVCGDVSGGRMLGVKGVVTGDKQVLATQIVFKAN